MWTLDDALTLIRQHQPLALKADCNLGLAGGVLNTGASTNDLDVLCVPRCARRKPDIATIVNAFFGPYQSPEILSEYDGTDDELSGRMIFRGQVAPGKRVDLIVIDFQPERK